MTASGNVRSERVVVAELHPCGRETNQAANAVSGPLVSERVVTANARVEPAHREICICRHVSAERGWSIKVSSTTSLQGHDAAQALLLQITYTQSWRPSAPFQPLPSVSLHYFIAKVGLKHDLSVLSARCTLCTCCLAWQCQPRCGSVRILVLPVAGCCTLVALLWQVVMLR